MSKKPEEKKPNPFYTPEAKAQRSKMRANLAATHIKNLTENNGVVGESIFRLSDKHLKGADTLFKRLSLKELEILKAVFCQCEEAGQYTALGALQEQTA